MRGAGTPSLSQHVFSSPLLGEGSFGDSGNANEHLAIWFVDLTCRTDDALTADLGGVGERMNP